MDFTIRVFKQLMNTLISNGYEFTSMEKFVSNPGKSKVVILRHDVDDRPDHSHKMSILEHELGICGTYYFRIVKQSFDKNVIRKIALLGHEIGYHYEDLALAKGDYSEAIKLFEKNLNQFRELTSINTICMHGSPISKFDNRLLWEKARYSDYGIICEPYFDVDFSNVLYLTDTGRRWDGARVSVRDKEFRPGVIPLSHHFRFRSTLEIIEAAKEGRLPDRLMINFHPQRWTDDPILWSRELVWQAAKNQVKSLIVKQNTKTKP